MAKMTFDKLKKMVLESIASESDIQGFESLSDHDLKKLIIDQIMERLDASNISDGEVSIKNITIFGSRGRGTARNDSDLDVVLEYEGSMREDDLFNILHDEDYEYGTMEINGIPVDVNPIRHEETGSLQNFLKKSKEYDSKILSQQVNEEFVGKMKEAKEQILRFLKARFKNEKDDVLENAAGIITNMARQILR